MQTYTAVAVLGYFLPRLRNILGMSMETNGEKKCLKSHEQAILGIQCFLLIFPLLPPLRTLS